MLRASSEQRLLVAGTEIIVVNPDHSKWGGKGITAGLADSLGLPRVRVLIDGEVYLCDPSDLAEN